MARKIFIHFPLKRCWSPESTPTLAVSHAIWWQQMNCVCARLFVLCRKARCFEWKIKKQVIFQNKQHRQNIFDFDIVERKKNRVRDFQWGHCLEVGTAFLKNFIEIWIDIWIDISENFISQKCLTFKSFSENKNPADANGILYSFVVFSFLSTILFQMLEECDAICNFFSTHVADERTFDVNNHH